MRRLSTSPVPADCTCLWMRQFRLLQRIHLACQPQVLECNTSQLRRNVGREVYLKKAEIVTTAALNSTYYTIQSQGRGWPTFHFQVKGTAVELVLVADFTPVVAPVVLLGLDDVHLKGVNLEERRRDGWWKENIRNGDCGMLRYELFMPEFRNFSSVENLIAFIGG